MFQTNDLNTSADSGAENKSTVDTGSVGQSFSKVFYDDVAANGILGLFNSLKDVTANIKGEIDSLLSFKSNWNRLKFLDTESADIIKSLGLGSQKAGEFRRMIADGAASFAGIGLSVEKVGETYLEIASAFNSNISVGVDDLTELAATAKVTGVAGKDLAASFRGVGVDIAGIGPRMFEVTKIARESGVAVSAVAKGVTTNLDKMNIYNFEGGVKGLAKMSAQASKLGIDMTKIFALTDKVFNPEGAIETAAALQRLGVTTNSLLDPLRLMDLSQNDPTELQNQIVNMTKDFVKFNKDLGEFQILPGEKRRLEEIAGALGLNNGELQKMALNSANLEYKMKQIKFPSSIASKEDRELIGTLAQMNKDKFGNMVAQVKIKEVDAEGKYTGEDKMVNVSELTVDQLKQIKEDQELRGSSMEDIAFDQLGELEKLNAKFDQFKKGVAYGASSGEFSQGIYKSLTTGTRETLFKGENNPNGIIPESALKTENWRDATNKMTSAISEGFDAVYKKLSTISSVSDIPGVFTEIGNMASNSLGGLTFENMMAQLEKMKPGSTTGIAGSSGVNTTNVNSVNANNSVANLNNINTSNVNNVIETKPQELNLNENVKIDLNVNLDQASKDQALTNLMYTALERFFSPDGGSKNIAFVLNEIEKQKTQNNLIQSNVPQ